MPAAGYAHQAGPEDGGCHPFRTPGRLSAIFVPGDDEGGAPNGTQLVSGDLATFHHANNSVGHTARAQAERGPPLGKHATLGRVASNALTKKIIHGNAGK